MNNNCNDSYDRIKKKIEEERERCKYCYIQGPRGAKGERGERCSATIKVGKVETIESTLPAEVINTETSEDVILDFKIPKGDKGEEGEKGPQGEYLNTYMILNENPYYIVKLLERQKNNFGKLYIHNVITKDDGLDVCLSKGNYYFSILIKNAIINDKHFATQSDVSKIICDKCQGCDEVPSCIYYQECVLKKREQPKDMNVIFLPRKNVPSNDHLAAVSLDSIKAYMTDLSLAQEYGKQWECSVIALSEVGNTEKAKKLADEIFGSSIEDKYFELAKESLRKE